MGATERGERVTPRLLAMPSEFVHSATHFLRFELQALYEVIEHVDV